MEQHVRHVCLLCHNDVRLLIAGHQNQQQDAAGNWSEHHEKPKNEWCYQARAHGLYLYLDLQIITIPHAIGKIIARNRAISGDIPMAKLPQELGPF